LDGDGEPSSEKREKVPRKLGLAQKKAQGARGDDGKLTQGLFMDGDETAAA
jgi:hypothetical protein